MRSRRAGQPSPDSSMTAASKLDNTPVRARHPGPIALGRKKKNHTVSRGSDGGWSPMGKPSCLPSSPPQSSNDVEPFALAQGRPWSA